MAAVSDLYDAEWGMEERLPDHCGGPWGTFINKRRYYMSALYLEHYRRWTNLS